MVYFRFISSAILTAIAYQTIGIASLISFLPIIIKSHHHRPIHYWVWGLTYMGILHFFLTELYTTSSIPIAIGLWILATLYTSLFYLLAGGIIVTLNKQFPISTKFHIPIAFGIIELLKGIGPYANPLGNIGYCLSYVSEWIPSYSIIGASGIGVAIIVINILISNILTKNNAIKSSIILSLSIILLCTLQLPTPKSTSHKKLSVSIIQTSIPQLTKMKQKNWGSIEQTIINLLERTNGKLVVLPETILPTIVEGRSFFNRLQTIANKQNQTIIFGSFIKKEPNVYNGSILISSQHQPQYYFKEKLMPFGEYLPLRPILKHIIPKKLLFNDFEKGTNNPTITINGTTIGQRICLEGIYSNMFNTNSDISIVIANNAWFNNSSSGNKLIQFIRVHAAERKQPILVSSNFGQSAIINQNGQLQHHLNHSHEGILEGDLIIQPFKTIYELFPNVGTLLFIFGYLIWLRNKVNYDRNKSRN